MLDCTILLAQSSVFLFKALLGLFLFGAFGLFATIGTFASKELLNELSGLIGTSNPLAARAACIVAAIVCWIFVAVSIAAFIGLVDFGGDYR